MADIVIRGVGSPKPNEGPYIMWVYPDGKTVVYSYVVNGDEFGPDSQKVIETTAAPLSEGHGRLIDADALLLDSGEVCEECGDGFSIFGFSREQIENAPTIVHAEGQN